jgi:hypothetical protein
MVYWHVKNVIMKFFPPKDERRMSKCCWHKGLGCIKSHAAFILKNSSCIYGFLDILSGFEKFMKK